MIKTVRSNRFFEKKNSADKKLHLANSRNKTIKDEFSQPFDKAAVQENFQCHLHYKKNQYTHDKNL